MAQFATVIAIKGSGTAHAVDAKGNTRVLKTGDVLQQGETVRTTGDARIELHFSFVDSFEFDPPPESSSPPSSAPGA